MAAIRRAEATWSGDLASGSGTVSAVSSNVFTDLPVSWAARTETPGGKTSPEELVAAAHAACFSMALSAALGRAGTPAERLDVTVGLPSTGSMVTTAVVSIESAVMPALPS